jgi:PAS domain S-box-containing protein
VGVFNFARNREAELARRDEAARADHIIRTAHDGIITTDESGSIEIFNPAAERLFGFTAGEAAGRSVQALLPGLFMVPADGNSRELDGRRKDGRTFAAEVVLSEVTSARRGFSVFVRDVTERRRAEASLASERNFVSAILDTAAAVVVILDTDGRFVRFNRACEEASGYGSEDLLGKCFWEVLTAPEERDEVQRSLSGLKSGICPAKSESCLYTRDGRRRRISWSNAILPDKHGAPAFLVSTGIDITEKVALQEQLLHAQKMEAVGRLAGGVAHDFNNLITVINGFGELLLDSFSGQDPRRSDAEEIRKAGERAACLTRQLLAFSRKHVTQAQILDLNSVVRDIETMLRRLVREDVQMEVELAPDLDRIRADRGQMEQVLINLAVNARDAMPTGGRLRIGTGNLAHSGRSPDLRTPLKPGAYVVLSVEDTGCGIGPETLPHLFEPFFTTKPQGIGTGLGLSTVYAIVTQCGGGVGVESAPGRGTRFQVYLPQASTAAEAGPAPAGAFQVMPRGAETVLLVEDDPDVRRVLGRILERSGYSVLVAADGPEAVGRASRTVGPIHLLVTDIVMPGVSGPELYRQLVEGRRGLKVLYVSGHTQEESVRDLSVSVDAAFLQKPFPPSLLARRVREVLDGGRMAAGA